MSNPPPARAQSPFAIQPALAALGALLLVAMGGLAIWTEAGPFAWVAWLQYRRPTGYAPGTTLGVTVAAFAFPALALGAVALAHRTTRLVCLGGAALFLAILLTYASAQLAGAGARTNGVTTFPQARDSAGWTPTDVSIPLDPRWLEGEFLEATTSGPCASTHTYTVLPRQAWGTAAVPVVYEDFPVPLGHEDGAPGGVVLAGGLGESLDSTGRTMEGTVRLGPVPLLVRHQWPDLPLFAVIVQEGGSRRRFWERMTVVAASTLFGVVLAGYRTRR